MPNYYFLQLIMQFQLSLVTHVESHKTVKVYKILSRQLARTGFLGGSLLVRGTLRAILGLWLKFTYRLLMKEIIYFIQFN